MNYVAGFPEAYDSRMAAINQGSRCRQIVVHLLGESILGGSKKRQGSRWVIHVEDVEWRFVLGVAQKCFGFYISQINELFLRSE